MDASRIELPAAASRSCVVVESSRVESSAAAFPPGKFMLYMHFSVLKIPEKGGCWTFHHHFFTRTTTKN
jgi:hypothetical protein